MQFLNAAALEKYEDAAKYAADFFALQGQDHLFTSNDYNTYGTVLEKVGRLDEAVAAYEKAVEVNPDKIDLLKDLSSAYASIAGEETDSVKRADLYYKSAEAYQKFIDKGEYVKAKLELKYIADVGMVGFPNAGKSTFISKVSNAKPKVANYKFTTLTPVLGVVKREDNELVFADIPGIIEGASDGVGYVLDNYVHRILF